MYRQKYALGRIKKNSKNKTFCTVLLNIVDNVPIFFFSPNITQYLAKADPNQTDFFNRKH